ncbi:hypothetical protein Pmani_008462 [Petrolisthes manimaculis]|uniref:XRCC4 coiled-coil domain-containing protein n=1 Tax=Petrolisthes manimaculis TaxID=1843537 RepID=A0AAE1Q5F1_9EUCA|nr:hypothetical protein Pmani_008462 [Petrolisthes manimaculis]
MGLRKVKSDGEAYMYTSNTQDTLTITVVQKDNSFKVKVGESTEGVVRWSRNLKKAPGEYMTLLTHAVDGSKAPHGTKGIEQQLQEEDVFEVQDGCLVWKQYFPDQKVYGKLGKFKMEKIDYEAAVSECLAGAVSDLSSKSDKIHKLERESEEMDKHMSEAIELAAKSVKAKEEFEKEIYGKCAAIINAKKHRIIQIKSAAASTTASTSHPTITQPPGESSHTSGRAEERVVSSRPRKKARVDHSGSDGYSSDTDVDDVDEVDLSSYDHLGSHTQKKSPVKPKSSVVSMKAIDSQELFNDSLELELYPTSSRNKTQTKNSSNCQISTNISHLSVGSSSKESSNKKSVMQEESEESILSQIF